MINISTYYGVNDEQNQIDNLISARSYLLPCTFLQSIQSHSLLLQKHTREVVFRLFVCLFVMELNYFQGLENLDPPPIPVHEGPAISLVSRN